MMLCLPPSVEPCFGENQQSEEHCTVMYKCITLDDQQSILLKDKTKAAVFLDKITTYNRNKRLEKIEQGND